MRALRALALVAVATGALLLPLDAFHRSAATGALMVAALHALLAIVVVGLAANGRPPSGRRERVAPALVLAQALALDAYLAFSPGQSAVVASVLDCLLVAATVLFAWQPVRVGVVAVAAAAAFALTGLVAGVPAGPFGIALVNVLVGGGIAVVCAGVLDDFRARLARRERELQGLSRQLMAAQEEERRKLSRELHDELGQSLTAVAAYLWLIEKDLPEPMQKLRGRTAEARRLVAKTLGEMREISQLLCPPVLALSGLVPSLEGQLRSFRDRHGIATDLRVHGVHGRLPSEVETALYRITQEALTNVARHARARSVRVSLVANEREIRLDVDDDGVGLPPAAATGTSGMGLLGMSERARALGGSVSVTSA
ncbi:MAG TPA: sensor histidine kinase, partial [Candidatus Binatia bacterium]|nr:sensor histidine kinase [Candidatus Binatia bacterium]